MYFWSSIKSSITHPTHWTQGPSIKKNPRTHAHTHTRTHKIFYNWYTPLSKINCNRRVLRFLSQNSLSKSPRPEVYWSHAMSGSWTTLWGRGKPISTCNEKDDIKHYIPEYNSHFRQEQWKAWRKFLYLFLQLVHKGDRV